ncbi:DUF3450 domain-containing protein [Desulforhopalus sp. 52FAK]
MYLQRRICFLFLLCLIVTNPCQGHESDQSKQIIKPVAESIRIRQSTQEHEMNWREEQQKLLARYDRLEDEKKRLTERENSLVEQLDTTQKRIAGKQEQLADIEQIRTDISPLIDTLNQRLELFVANDLPFLTEERKARLQRIAEFRDDPEVSVSEKFRKVMEALLVEAEYGNSIEVYQQTISTGGREALVDIFRLGRVGLFFQSLGQKQCGFYNVATSSWQELPSSYKPTIRSAMEIGAKQRPVELLTLPLGRMQL